MLTPEQQKFVEKWYWLIFSYACERKLLIEEWYGVLAIALCKAAQAFDESQGTSFMSFVYRIMKNEVWKEWITQNRKHVIPKKMITSYNDTVTGPNGNPTERIELLHSSNTTNNIDYTRIEVQEFRDSLVGLQRDVFDGLMSGDTCADVGRDLNLSREYIRQIKVELRHKWTDFCAA